MTTGKQMWNADIRKIVAILQERFHLGEVIMDPAEYVAKYNKMLRAAGPELAFLQLATLDKKSPLGWKPTALLMKFVAARADAGNLTLLYEADIWCQLLNDYVFGYESDRGKASVFAYELLVAIGLMHDHGLEAWITEPLQSLFEIGYYHKRQQDGLQIVPELSATPFQVVMRPGT